MYHFFNFIHFHGFFIWFLKHESSNVYDEKIKETDIMTRNKVDAKIVAMYKSSLVQITVIIQCHSYY